MATAASVASAVAPATLGASTLDDAIIFSLFGSWHRSSPLAQSAAARAVSPASPCSFTLNGGTAPPASLDGSAPRDATASSLSLTGSMPKGLPPIDTMAASAASLASLNSFTLSGAAMLASLLIFAQG